MMLERWRCTEADIALEWECVAITCLEAGVVVGWGWIDRYRGHFVSFLPVDVFCQARGFRDVERRGF